MDDVTAVYTEGGTVRHYLNNYDASPNVGSEAFCGRTPWPGLWHGTGSQEEYEVAADMQPCSQCDSILKHRSNHYLMR